MIYFCSSCSVSDLLQHHQSKANVHQAHSFQRKKHNLFYATSLPFVAPGKQHHQVKSCRALLVHVILALLIVSSLNFSCISSVQFSRSVMSDSLRPHEPQHARPPCPWPTPGVYPNSCPLSQWCHPAISSLVVPFSSVLNLSQHQGLFQWVRSSHQVAKVLEFQLQHQSLQWTLRTDL